ncbi:MAG: TolC family protein [Gammaproteobacteria bacterium]|nr:TolC family protein [Gammaproteobacteria bacterium]MBU0850650.1 TolC family protein [Gammaproteobacteria bacterium]MBU1267759.1 TolC family protein [Gammaproteobacteria bacterium]MBU1529616.1 TolC family protein [Gammaproteobacteria bacterium]MBU1780662.1 TolC family protein [Gammaproteobacteria bacterium]
MANILKRLMIVFCCCALAPNALAQSVEQLLQQAIETSPEVAKAKAQLLVATADLKISKASWLPQASARLYNGVGDTKQSNPFSSQRNANENIQNNSVSVQQNIYNKPASIQIEQTQLTVQEAELRHALAIQSTIQNWVEKLMQCKQVSLRLKLAEQKAHTALLKKTQTEQSLKHGESSALELANALTDLSLRQAELGEAKHMLAQKLWEISQLTGQTIEASRIDKMEFTIPGKLISDREIEHRIIRQNLNLKIQSLYTDVAELEINKAKGQHYPTVKLVAQNTQSQSETASTLGNRVKQNVVALQVDIPLFNGFATQAQTEKASASLNKQQADYENTLNQAMRKAWTAMRQLDGATELLTAYGQAMESATQQQEAIETAIKHQLATPFDLAQTREKLAELQLKKLEHVMAANKAYLQVQELIGELNVENAAERISAIGKEQ